MKFNNIIAVSIALVALFIVGCDKDQDEAVPQEEVVFEEHHLMTKSLTRDGDTIVKMVDQFVNLGSEDIKVLFPVHHQTLILEEGFEGLWFPIHKEKMLAFGELYAQEFDLPFTTVNEQAHVFRSILNFVMSNKIDAGLLLELTTNNSSNTELATVMTIIEERNTLKSSPVNKLPSANDQLYSIYDGSKTVEEIMIEHAALKAALTTSEGTGWEIGLCINEVVHLGMVWFDFAKDNKAVTDMENYAASYLSTDDTNANNYTGGKPFKSATYKLSYDPWGSWVAKLEYHIEGIFGATHPTIPGKYILETNTICTTLKCKGTLFVVEGSTEYSPAINTGSFEEPVAEMNGKVSATYGDGCSFRFHSYLNFKINAETGFKEVNFSTGRKNNK